MELKKPNYDAILGQNFLTYFKANIDLGNKFIEIKGQRMYFNNVDSFFIINEIYNFETSNIKELNTDHLNQEEKKKLNYLLQEYEELFFKEGDQLTSAYEVQHEIYTTINNAIFSKIYRYPKIHEQEIEIQINEMLKQNIIKPSNSPYNSPLWIVPKKSDNSGKQKWRIVIDYRKLNEVTISDKFPLPNIDSTLEKLGMAQYFTTLDLAKGFHQILVREEDRKKTAFSTPFGHFEYLRMPFGLKNAPATFQRLMNSVLVGLINKICIVYLDDILIFSTSLKEHLDSIKRVFKRLRETGLKIQVDKCNFLKRETEFLGHVLTPEGVKPNPNKIKVIQELKLPNTLKQIKSFLGVTGYYRKFIRDYAKIAYPITRYLKMGMKINENDPNYISAFEKLKNIISEHPILKYPDFNKKFVLVTDASNFALGAVLTQDGHPISFASRTLNDHERNYSTIEKELLAIVWGTKYFRPYLFGKEFNLKTDHQPIKWLHAKYSGKDISPRLQRWLISLGEYDIKIDYIKGSDNKVADFLSRINVETKEINTSENVSLKKNKNVDIDEVNMIAYDEDDTINVDNNLNNEEINESMNADTIHSQEQDENDHIHILETIVNKFRIQIILKVQKDKENETVFGYRRIFIDKNDLENNHVEGILKRYIKSGRVGIYSELNDHEYNKLQQIIINSFPNNNNIKFSKCRFFAQDVEDEETLKKQVSLFHKNEVGHSGIIATYEGIKNKIYNPEIRTVIHKIINNCDICSSGKYDRNPIKQKFSLTETPSTINEIIHVDTYVNSHHSFINFIDKFSKHVVSFYLEDRHSKTITEKLRMYIATKGKIKKIVFDNEFNTKHIKEFCQEENIEYHITKPNSHTGNSDIERFNNTVTERIRTLNLDEALPIKTQMFKAVKFYNRTYHSTIKATPIDVQEKKVDQKIIFERLKNSKIKTINKRNQSRENYNETREKGFIKNYKSVRHKEQPKFRYHNLEGIHETNIKRPLKFTDTNNSNNNIDNNTTRTNIKNKKSQSNSVVENRTQPSNQTCNRCKNKSHDTENCRAELIPSIVTINNNN